MKVAFLDRDGTINRDYPDDIWPQIQYPEILPGAIRGLQYLKEKGYEIIIVTNQYIIGEKMISTEQYHEFSNRLTAILADNGIRVLDIFYCPHARSEQCDCCKPKDGLIRQAIRKYPEIDLQASFMCGDSLSDMKCAESIGLDFWGINIGTQRIGDLSDLCDLLQ